MTLAVDRRCPLEDCAGGSYTMAGACRNCGAQPILVTHSTGHQAEPAECPVCECVTVQSVRLATADELAPEPIANEPAE